VVHGDLKGVRGFDSGLINPLTPSQQNILVDGSGNALIADFGLAAVTLNLDSIRSATHDRGYTPRWAAPEVLNDGIFSKEGDTFSFAMIMIEVCRGWSTVCIVLADRRFVSMQVFSGAVPFVGKTHAKAMANTMDGIRPPRPEHPTLTTELWELIERCWNQDPHSRPEISEVLNDLRDT